MSNKEHLFDSLIVQVRKAQERAERREEKRGSKHFMKDMTFSIKSQAKASNLNKVGWLVGSFLHLCSLCLESSPHSTTALQLCP